MEQMDCVRGWMRRFSVTFKLAIILGLVLALLIPLGMIGSLLKERMMRRDEAVANITYLYVVLQLQNYSLLFGTAGLFIVLGIIMYATRNVDWLTRDLTAAEVKAES